MSSIVQSGRFSQPQVTQALVLAALFLTGFMLYGGGLYAFILLVPIMAQEHSWSEAQVGGLVSAFWLSAPLALWTKPIIARFGTRKLTIAGILIEAAALIALIAATSLWQVYLLRALAGLGKVLFAITVPIMIRRYFHLRYGTALAIAYSGWHLGGFLLAPLVGEMAGRIGWQVTSVILGCAILAITIVPAYWATSATRNAAFAHLDEPPTASADTQTGLRMVLRDRRFLVVALAGTIYYLIYGGLLAHQPGALVNAGIDSRWTGLALGLTAAVAVLGSIGIGWLTDRMSPQRLSTILIGCTLAGGACLVALTFGPKLLFLVLHVVIFGIAVGGADVYWITTVRKITPSDRFTAAWGIFYFVMLASIVIGPIAVGAMFDRIQNYPLCLAIESMVLLIPLVMMWLLPTRLRGDPPLDVSVKA